MVDTERDPTMAAPLRLPAILQNPTNPSLRQVEAHNAQQREKSAARRDTRTAPVSSERPKGEGKRVLRRRDNATFAANPHIAQPRRSDYYPSVPLHSRPARPAFPPNALPRSVPLPPADLPERDPFAPSSVSGTFSTSLKGTRALLRKRGRRVEFLVGLTEKEIRAWLDGEGWELNPQHRNISWRVIDPLIAEPDPTTDEESLSTSPTAIHRLPTSHTPLVVPPLPLPAPSILELSRSPAHLTWAVADPFDRLVIHLLARYYELLSWSANHPTTSGKEVRLTHLVIPSILKPKVPAGGLLPTPETTDLSSISASDRDLSDITETESDTGSEGTEGTEMGDEVEGYSLERQGEGDRTITSPHRGATALELEGEMAELGLRSHAMLARALSNDSDAYASSEGGSDFSGMADSVELPLPPAGSRDPAESTELPRLPRVGEGNGGWISVLSDEETLSLRPSKAGKPVRLPVLGDRGRVDKLTFFEYLYGA